MSEGKLNDFLKTGKDWSRLRTNIPGIFILKISAYKRVPSRLTVELNPVNDKGNPSKRRGLVLRTKKELEMFSNIFRYNKLSKLLNLLDSINTSLQKSKLENKDVIEL